MASYYFDYSKVQNDSRISDVESGKKSAQNQVNAVYDGMINKSDQFYQAQIDASKEYAETQKKNQQEQTDFAIEQIEQQKDQAHKDYIKEQSGAYVDWQKQSGEYGANAEQMAVQGMGGTGYSESSQVSMYNTYQNRIATAREAYGRAVLNYDNAIKDARLQNNAALAEIAYNALQTQLELALEGFQYKNSLIMAKTDKNLEIDNQYWGRYQDVLDQINTEVAFNEDVRQYEKSYAEEVRQYNENLKEEQRQYNQSLAMEKAKLAEEQRQFNVAQAAKASGGGSSGSSRVKKSSSSSKSSSSKSKGETNRGSGIKKSSSSSSTKKTSGSSSATIDMNSVLALGYGPISASKLSELESKGLVQSYKSGNKIKFKKSAYAIKQSMLFK